jgi:hypothetical protein
MEFVCRFYLGILCVRFASAPVLPTYPLHGQCCGPALHDFKPQYSVGLQAGRRRLINSHQQQHNVVVRGGGGAAKHGAIQGRRHLLGILDYVKSDSIVGAVTGVSGPGDLVVVSKAAHVRALCALRCLRRVMCARTHTSDACMIACS